MAKHRITTLSGVTYLKSILYTTCKTNKNEKKIPCILYKSHIEDNNSCICNSNMDSIFQLCHAYSYQLKE